MSRPPATPSAANLQDGDGGGRVAREADGVSAEVPDWSREAPRRPWDPPRRLLACLRRYQRWAGRRGPLARLVRGLAVLQHRFWSAVTGADIPLNAQLGGGLLLPHPNGVVIHPDARVGPNCLILQQVTLVGGVRLGGHVDLGAGAKVVRPVTIADHASVGANAVVLTDVPRGATAVGVPARVVPAAPLTGGPPSAPSPGSSRPATAGS